MVPSEVRTAGASRRTRTFEASNWQCVGDLALAVEDLTLALRNLPLAMGYLRMAWPVGGVSKPDVCC